MEKGITNRQRSKKDNKHEKINKSFFFSLIVLELEYIFFNLLNKSMVLNIYFSLETRDKAELNIDV